MNFRRRKREISVLNVNIIPMVDVFLQLIIFFLASTTFAVASLDVKLPSSQTAKAEVSRNIVVTITRNNTIYVNNEETRGRDLEARLAEELAKSGDKLVILQADESVLHGKVVRIMDIAREAGAERIAIATEPPLREIEKSK